MKKDLPGEMDILANELSFGQYPLSHNTEKKENRNDIKNH